MKLILQRICATPDGAFGTLRLDEHAPFAVTLEPTYVSPDSEHEPKIEAGLHRCTRTTFYRAGYETYEIRVPGHTRILFHRGNTNRDSDGCVLVAEKFADFGETPGIGESAEGFREFMSRTSGAFAFDLEVIDPPKVTGAT